MRDSDAFMHLHNSRYIDYFFDAREDHLREYYDLDLNDHVRRTRQGWVVSGTQIRYFAPAPMGALIEIVTRLIDCDDKRLVVEGRMHDEGGGVLHAVMWTWFRAVNVTDGRASTHVPSLTQLLEDVVYPVAEKTLDERANVLRGR
jgi:acyl-CoA thioester hydrolase